MIRANSPPSWVYPGAKFDLDFRNLRWWGGYVDQKAVSEDKGSLCTDSGGYNSTCYTPQRNGILKVGGSSAQNRITDLGFFTERGATNQALWSRDMTNAAWAAVNITALKDQPSADNLATANTASSITSGAINGTILQSVILTSRSFIYSAWIKRLVGSGTVSMTVDGTTYTDITSQLNSNTYTWVQIPLQTIANPIFGFKIAVSGDSIAVDFNQCESGSQILASSLATTPIPCTNGSTVTRGNQTGYFSSSTGISTGNAGQALVTNIFSTGGPFSMLMSWNGDATTGTPNGPGMIATDLTSPSTMNGGIGVGFGNGTRTANQGTNGRGNWNKSCFRTNGKGTQGCLNGGALYANTNASNNLPNRNVGGTHFNIGNNGAGTVDTPLNGSVGRVTFWNREITDGQMIEYSSLTNPYDPYP